MSKTIRLTASDGFSFSAYLAEPAQTPRGAVVVVQEIFGVNTHIRSIADRLAAEGYLAIAPALFDRAQTGFETGYSKEDLGLAMTIVPKINRESALLDVAAARDAVAGAGRVGVVGFCWGGTMAWASAAKLDGIAAAIGYYGGGVLSLTDLQPNCPVMLHFGAKDAHIPVAQVQEFAAARPEIPTYIYDADHGFNCDARASYDATAAKLAWKRSLDLFTKTLA